MTATNKTGIKMSSKGGGRKKPSMIRADQGPDPRQVTDAGRGLDRILFLAGGYDEAILAKPIKDFFAS